MNERLISAVLIMGCLLLAAFFCGRLYPKAVGTGSSPNLA
jgi:hypothetical protein